jgi:hypothetical protein
MKFCSLVGVANLVFTVLVLLIEKYFEMNDTAQKPLKKFKIESENFKM